MISMMMVISSDIDDNDMDDDIDDDGDIDDDSDGHYDDSS